MPVDLMTDAAPPDQEQDEAGTTTMNMESSDSSPSTSPTSTDSGTYSTVANDHENDLHDFSLPGTLRVLVTGCAGFIGSHLTERLLSMGHTVIGIDAIDLGLGQDRDDPQGSVQRKRNNLDAIAEARQRAAAASERWGEFTFVQEDIRTSNIVTTSRPNVIIHLAALAGVRPSVDDPEPYMDINLKASARLMTMAAEVGTTHVLYASSSSVYGDSPAYPCTERDAAEVLKSPYACSKRSMEFAMGCNSFLTGVTAIGFRFFTVFGPRGRPDMAPYKFLRLIADGKPITMFGDGTTERDYTYVGDIVNGMILTLEARLKLKSGVYNLGSDNPIALRDLIGACEKLTGKSASIIRAPVPATDVLKTHAELTRVRNDVGYEPTVSFLEGMDRMWQWMNAQPPTLV